MPGAAQGFGHLIAMGERLGDFEPTVEEIRRCIGGDKRVRRGRVELARRIDLHGHTQVSAARLVRNFLSEARDDGERTVLVITGKGRNGVSVIRRNFLDWIASAEGATLVSGYAEAHAKHGGAGAFYVFLRKA